MINKQFLLRCCQVTTVYFHVKKICFLLHGKFRELLQHLWNKLSTNTLFGKEALAVRFCCRCCYCYKIKTCTPFKVLVSINFIS